MTKTMYERLGIAPGDIPEIDTLVYDYGQHQLSLNEAEKTFALYDIAHFLDDEFFVYNPQAFAYPFPEVIFRPEVRKEFETRLEPIKKLPKTILLKLLIIYAEDLLNQVYSNDTNHSLSKR